MTAVDVHFTVSGPEDAPVVVLSNSLGSTHRMWDAQVADLERRFRVVRYDTRGHGGSPVPAGPLFDYMNIHVTPLAVHPSDINA